MALTLGDNFSYQGAKPLDARLKYDTLANMKAVADATMYEGCLAYCEATDKTYQWKSTNTVDADTGKWREFETGGGGASALSELTDTNISTPTDGQVLQYDGTNDEWVNGDVEAGGVVQGYAYAQTGSGLDSILEALNQEIGTQYNVEVIKSWTGYEAYDNPTSFVFLYDDTNKTASLMIANNSVALYHASNGYAWYCAAKLTDSSDSATAIKSSSAINVVNNVATVSGITEFTLTNNYETWGRQAEIITMAYVAGSVDMTEFGEDSRVHYTELDVTPIHGELQFYSDSAHTQLITPSTGEMYYDITTHTTYIWDSTQYVQTSGGAGASSVEELTDVDVETLSDGDILQYNGTTEKWENAELPEVDTTKLYSTEDTTSTALEDADTIPFCDVSISAKRQSTWSNIKSTLKTYFDTLYSTVKTKGTPASGGTDLSLVTTGDMYDWNNKANTPTIIAETIAVGSTSVTFSNVPTSGNYLITPFFSVVGLEYDSVSQSGSTVTVTFPTQSSIAYAYLKIESV